MLKQFSRTFNSTQVVREMEAARECYMDDPGFKKYLYHNGASDHAGANVLGLPHNLSTEIDREIWIINPDGLNEGSIELLAFDDITGRDFSTKVIPPNLGIMTLRFPVTGIEYFEQNIIEKNINIETTLTTISIPYYDSVKIIAIRAPDGAWLGFFE